MGLGYWAAALDYLQLQYDKRREMANFTDPQTLMLLGAASGFLDPQGGMAGGFQGALHGLSAGNAMRQMQMQEQAQQRKLLHQIEMQNYLQQHAQAGTPTRKVINDAMLTGNPELIAWAGNAMKSIPKVKQSLKGVSDDGKATYRTLYDTGDIEETGITPYERPMQINTGDAVSLVNPTTGNPMQSFGVNMSPGERARLAQDQFQFGMSHDLARRNYDINQARFAMDYDPSYQATKAGAIKGAQTQAAMDVESRANLPKVIQQGEQTIKLVDDLLNHPGFGVSVGKTAPIGSAMSYIPGTQAASFDIALKQIKGKQFLEAFETLKGGGQITQIEGEKATHAMSRMEKANTEEEFTKASREFQEIIQLGIDRAKQKAGMQPSNRKSYISPDGFSSRVK